MSEHPIESMMGTTMDKIKEMADVNTVIGDPITTADGTVIIPISKVSYGFASGGSDLPSKSQPLLVVKLPQRYFFITCSAFINLHRSMNGNLVPKNLMLIHYSLSFSICISSKCDFFFFKVRYN